MQQRALSSPGCRHLERSSIPEPIRLANLLHDTRQSGLDRKGHQDASIECLRRGFGSGADAVLPQTVQVLPISPHELWARVFRQHAVGQISPPIASSTARRRAATAVPMQRRPRLRQEPVCEGAMGSSELVQCRGDDLTAGIAGGGWSGRTGRASSRRARSRR